MLKEDASAVKMRYEEKVRDIEEKEQAVVELEKQISDKTAQLNQASEVMRTAIALNVSSD